MYFFVNYLLIAGQERWKWWRWWLQPAAVRGCSSPAGEYCFVYINILALKFMVYDSGKAKNTYAAQTAQAAQQAAQVVAAHQQQAAQITQAAYHAQAAAHAASQYGGFEAQNAYQNAQQWSNMAQASVRRN